MIRRLSLFLFCLALAHTAVSQRLYRGIVVDSATLTNLPGVHVSVKNSGKGSVTDATGVFLIYAKQNDTLSLSSIGYVPVELPLIFQEDALFVLMRENKLLLPEIVVKSTRLYPNKIEDQTKSKPKTLSALEGVVSPFDYFWKLEREKRKLSRVVEESNRTQTFRQVITDPVVMEIMKKEYGFTDETYYDLLVRFNQEHGAVHYFTDADAIMEELHSFFEKFRVPKSPGHE